MSAPTANCSAKDWAVSSSSNSCAGPSFFSENSMFMSGPSDTGDVVSPLYIGLGRAPNKAPSQRLIPSNPSRESGKGGFAHMNKSRVFHGLYFSPCMPLNTTQLIGVAL